MPVQLTPLPPQIVRLAKRREATVNHIPTPYRFAVVLDYPTTIGRRRAAQRVMAAASKVLAAGGIQASASGAEIDAVLRMLARSMSP